MNHLNKLFHGRSLLELGIVLVVIGILIDMIQMSRLALMVIAMVMYFPCMVVKVIAVTIIGMTP